MQDQAYTIMSVECDDQIHGAAGPSDADFGVMEMAGEYSEEL